MLKSLIQKRPTFFRVVFAIAFVTSLGLFIGGFFVPPAGEIDGSVLTAGGILLGFATMSMLPELVASKRTTTITHGDTTVTLGEIQDECEKHTCQD